jgi:hypothetical protein
MSTQILCRGGKLVPWVLRPDDDPTWSAVDWGRAAAIEARFASLGVSEAERRRLVPCAVLKAKWSELVFSTAVEKRLASLAATG